MVDILQGPKEWERTVRCSCKAKLRATGSDLRVGHFGANWGGETPERLPYFECPTCGRNHKIAWDGLPSPLIARLNAAQKP